MNCLHVYSSPLKRRSLPCGVQCLLIIHLHSAYRSMKAWQQKLSIKHPKANTLWLSAELCDRWGRKNPYKARNSVSCQFQINNIFKSELLPKLFFLFSFAFNLFFYSMGAFSIYSAESKYNNRPVFRKNHFCIFRSFVKCFIIVT